MEETDLAKRFLDNTTLEIIQARINDRVLPKGIGVAVMRFLQKGTLLPPELNMVRVLSIYAPKNVPSILAPGAKIEPLAGRAIWNERMKKSGWDLNAAIFLAKQGNLEEIIYARKGAPVHAHLARVRKRIRKSLKRAETGRLREGGVFVDRGLIAAAKRMQEQRKKRQR